jgi:hypothetical protein
MPGFRKDDRVSHARFGPGLVIGVDGRYTIIEFDEGGARKFLTSMVQLKRSELQLPPKPASVRRRRRTVKAGDSVAAQDET